jgi:hypothetical protein
LQAVANKRGAAEAKLALNLREAKSILPRGEILGEKEAVGKARRAVQYYGANLGAKRKLYQGPSVLSAESAGKLNGKCNKTGRRL